MSTELEKLIWEGWLTADMNKRYWAEMARRYQWREVGANVLIAVTSSTTVLTWIIGKQIDFYWLEGFWETLSIVAAVMAVSLPILNYSSKIASMVELVVKWKDIESAYESLWIRLPELSTPDALEELTQNRTKESEISSSEARLPYDKRLQERCQKEVIESRQGYQRS